MNAATDDSVPFAASALAGLVVVGGIGLVSRRNEAIDDPAYYVLGIPMMCVAIAFISYRFPLRTWRWTFTMVAGQATALVLGGSGLSLWPLSLIFLTICSLPQFFTGWLAGYISRRQQ